MKSIHKLVLFVLFLFAFVGCRPTYFDVRWEESYYDSISNYWLFTHEKTLCYVNDCNDTIFWRATIHKQIFHREDFQNEHPQDYYEGQNEYFYIIHSLSDSTQNSLHKNISIENRIGITFGSELDTPGWYYPEYYFYVRDSDTNERFCYARDWKRYENKFSLTKFFTDTIAFLRSNVQDNASSADTAALLVRNKGVVWWIDKDGHRWELVAVKSEQ